MSKLTITNCILNGFLLKERIKGKYLNNMYAQHEQDDSSILLNKDHEHCNGCIISAFSWDETLEGHFFWEEINQKYIAYHRIYKDK